MDEQSHKEEMRAALRGDFERLRARRGGDPVAAPVERVGAVAPPVETAPMASVPESRASWVGRLLGRS